MILHLLCTELQDVVLKKSQKMLDFLEISKFQISPNLSQKIIFPQNRAEARLRPSRIILSL
jgi:hypothetical protein